MLAYEPPLQIQICLNHLGFKLAAVDRRKIAKIIEADLRLYSNIVRRISICQTIGGETMDKELKFRLDDLERKILAVDKRFDEQSKRFDDQGKRFDDVKWLVGATSAIFTIAFGVITVIAGWNYSGERQGLRDFQKEIKEQVMRTDDTKLELQGLDGNDLSGQEIEAKIERFLISNQPNVRPDPSGVPHLTFSFVIKNSGDVGSGPLYVKIYSKDVKLAQKSSDEKTYTYEDYIYPTSMDPSSVPGKMSVTIDLRLFLLDADIRPGRHTSLLKIYYGRGKVALAPIYFRTSEQ